MPILAESTAGKFGALAAQLSETNLATGGHQREHWPPLSPMK